MTTETTTVQGLAAIASRSMAQDTRDDGSTYWHRKDDAPEWLDELCHEAHGEMFADDWRYKFIVEALDALAESDDLDEVGVEADIMTHDLTAWLHSRLDRYAYVDDAVKEYGHSDTVIRDIAMGQEYEKDEVLGLVRGFLERLVTGEEDEEEKE